ncbi:LOB domain-containing protein 41-like [Actinidia eriantha]|uniref:LOB domain-containing protein 41-like n=1 Tax=Actinidia eriantha TaxID=165200 RepID=UPI0025895478|nr:LOB domain-containing protein 41-like [Actinidia eriantha]
MRMSCNGCRVLRKGCSDNCSIRPCLQWIKSSESQANATVFLAKFYGRAGLINLINAGPDHLRPAIFRSLLYEACGRIANPIYGSVGLLWSGNWLLCQNAVEAVLNGSPITQIGSEAAECDNGPPLKAYDIRHVSKEDSPDGSKDLHRVRTRCRFKRSAAKPKASRVWSAPVEDSGHDDLNRSTSHESSLSHVSEAVAAAELNVEGESREVESVLKPNEEADDGEIELELTLGFEPSSRSHNVSPKRKSTCRLGDSFDDGACKIVLGLD